MLAANQLDEVISQIKDFDIDAAMAEKGDGTNA
jgi:thioredoxin reductase (NADPH)